MKSSILLILFFIWTFVGMVFFFELMESPKFDHLSLPAFIVICILCGPGIWVFFFLCCGNMALSISCETDYPEIEMSWFRENNMQFPMPRLLNPDLPLISPDVDILATVGDAVMTDYVVLENPFTGRLDDGIIKAKANTERINLTVELSMDVKCLVVYRRTWRDHGACVSYFRRVYAG